MKRYELNLTQFTFPENLSNSRANFRFVVDLRYLDEKNKFTTEHAVMPSLDTFWECDKGKKENPNYVRMNDDSPSFDMAADPPKINPWDRLILIVICERLHSIQFKVIDVDRRDAWDRVKSFLGGVVQAVVGRAKGQIPTQTIFANSLGQAADDVQSFMLKRLAGGDKVLFRGSYQFDRKQDGSQQDHGKGKVSGKGTEGDYNIQFSWSEYS